MLLSFQQQQQQNSTGTNFFPFLRPRSSRPAVCETQRNSQSICIVMNALLKITYKIRWDEIRNKFFCPRYPVPHFAVCSFPVLRCHPYLIVAQPSPLRAYHMPSADKYHSKHIINICICFDGATSMSVCRSLARARIGERRERFSIALTRKILCPYSLTTIYENSI